MAVIAIANLRTSVRTGSGPADKANHCDELVEGAENGGRVEQVPNGLMAAPNNIQFNGVGGLRTYANDQLAQLPLKWIMEKAALHGLAFRVSVEIDGDVTTSPVCDSYGPFLYGFYRLYTLGKRFFREVGQKLIVEPNSTRETINETIDASVFQRWANDETYRPENLDDWRQGILLIQQKSVLLF